MESRIETVPLEAIRPDPNQPRRSLPTVDEVKQYIQQGSFPQDAVLDGIRNLASSILLVDLFQPIIITQSEANDGTFIILDGHRRWLATWLLYLENKHEGSIRAQILVRPVENRLLSQLHLNLQQQDLDLFALARSLRSLFDEMCEHGGAVWLVRKDGSPELERIQPRASAQRIWQLIGDQLGLSPSRLHQIVALNRLPAVAVKIAIENRIPESKLRLVLPLGEPEIMQTAVEFMVANPELTTDELKVELGELKRRLVEATTAKLPRPSKVASVLKQARGQLSAINALSVDLAHLAMTRQDRRTTSKWGTEVIPEIEGAIADLQATLERLSYLKTQG